MDPNDAVGNPRDRNDVSPSSGIGCLTSRQNDGHGEEQVSIATPPEEQHFPFMRLPLELRLRIYEMHLAIPGVIASGAAYCIDRGRDSPKRLDVCQIHNRFRFDCDGLFDKSLLNLWSTSKLVYQESIPIFFRLNHFHFGNFDYLHTFLSHVGITSRRNIISISFEYGGRSPVPAIKLLRECIGLKKLTIYLTWSTEACRYGTDSSNVPKLFGLADLLKIRGISELEVVPHAYRENIGNHSLLCRKAFEEALQVLKQPHKPAWLTRQYKKDYPQGNERMVFGKANVETRAEKKFIASLPAASS
ncbi:hypothetical protein ACLMJK_005820 [Lecanora helva]